MTTLVVGDDYFLNMERIFERDRSIVGVNGEVIADGANSPGFTFEEGLRLVEQYNQRQKPSPSCERSEVPMGATWRFGPPV